MRIDVLRIGFLILIGAASSGRAGESDPVVTIHTDRPAQRIDGFGVSLSQWDAASRRLYATEAARDAFLGLGLNILRMDLRKEVLVHAPDDFQTPVLLGDDLDANVARMDFDLLALRVYADFFHALQAAAANPDALRLIGSVWSPPHWMKGPTGRRQNFIGVTGDLETPFLAGLHVPWNAAHPTPDGASVGGRLRTEDPRVLEQYGRYLAAWVVGFERHYGIPLACISLQNEATFENPFDSMTLAVDARGREDFSQYALALKAVQDAWGRFGLTTPVIGPHVAHFRESPANPFGLYAQDRMILAVKQHPDRALIDFLAGYAANFYNQPDESNVQNVAAFYQGGRSVAADQWTWHTPPGVAGDGKPIWFCEAGGESADASGALQLALNLQAALLHGQAGAYLYWQLVNHDDLQSRHTLLTPDQLRDPPRSAKYAAFAHFSRFIPPGSLRLEADFADGSTCAGGRSTYDLAHGLSVSVFHHRDTGRFTCVLLNALDQPRRVTLILPPDSTIPAWQIHLTNAAEHLAPQPDAAIAGGRAACFVPARSLVTLTGAERRSR